MKSTPIEFKNIIKDTPKEYNGHKPNEWPCIPVGYTEHEGKRYYYYVIYCNTGLLKVVVNEKYKIIASGDLPF